MKAAITEARTAKAAAIVLSMDTSGGAVTEAEAIVDLIIENKDLRFIALVNKALSAGAAITLACKEIYVTEAATIGAAVGKKTLVIPKMVHLGSLTIIVGQPSRTMMPPSRVLRTL
jgi:membrane-bound ClpP family serine protease